MYQVAHLLGEAPLPTVVTAPDHPEHLVNGRARRQRAVEDAELALEALRDVVPPASRLDHRGEELHAARRRDGVKGIWKAN